MNGRKAKALRRQAEKETIGMTDRSYQRVRQQTNNPERQAFAIELGDCTRRRYKQLKRNPI